MSLLGGSEKLSKNEGGVLRTGVRVPAPSSPRGQVIGDLWYDTATLTLKAWDGSTWVAIGGGSSSGLWYLDVPNNALATPKNIELLDHTMYLRAANDACHRIKFSSGTEGDLGSMDGVAVMGNARSALFSNSCGGGTWRLIWDTSGDVVYVRSHLSVAPSGSHFNDPESITLSGNSAGSSSGISMRSRTNNNIRWVLYPESDNFRFWRDGTERVVFREDGSILTTDWDTNSRLKLGRWHANGAYGAVMLGQQIETVNAGHYLIMGSMTDSNSFVSPRASPGALFIRCANNGATVATFGDTNTGTGNDLNICLALPPIGGIVTQWSAGSHQFGYTPSAQKHKMNIRTLRDTPELDAGEHNPVFKMRPVRHKWKKWTKPGSFGLVNADEINTRHPNGVAGLLAEEVYELCPDAVHVKEAKPEWHWQEGDGLPETGPDGELIIYKPAEPEMIMGLDTDRLLAYVIDSVQHLKEELDTSKDQIKVLKEELKNIKGSK